MRKTAALYLAAVMLLPLLSGCTATAEELLGESEGYGGQLRVAVSMADGRISNVRVVEHHETEGVGTLAIDALPQAIVEANSAEVDDVSGATRTSQAIKAAVRQAMDEADDTPARTGSPAYPDGVRMGVGMSATGRLGPGKDADGTPVYSINVVFAGASFDADGRITALAIDQLETATPNYDGTGMPRFSGFPGQGGYPRYDDAAKALNGRTEDSENAFLSEITDWRTKNMRGEEYMLPAGSWRKQMDAYEVLFTGMTVEEIDSWFETYCSQETGRPLTADGGSTADQARFAELTGEAQELLTDVTSAATISLRDAHGDILLAIHRAWEDAMRAENMS